MSYTGVLVFNIKDSWEEFYPHKAATFTLLPQSDLFRFLYVINQNMVPERACAFQEGFQLRICCDQSSIKGIEVVAITRTGQVHSTQVKFPKEDTWETQVRDGNLEEIKAYIHKETL